MALTDKSFATGHYDVVIDGAPLTAYVKSVEGGLISATSVEEARGAYHLRDRHLATRQIEPLSIEFGASGGGWALRYLDKLLSTREHKRFSGRITSGDINFKQQYQQHFENALMTELALPKADATSKDFATIKVKLQPELSSFTLGEGPKIGPRSVDKQKQWTCSAFRMSLGPFDMSHVISVEALTFKIGVKAFQQGGFQLPVYHPTKIELPKLVFTMPMKYARPVVDWFSSAVGEQGSTDNDYELDGSLEFLDQSRSKTIYEIEFGEVGPEKMTILKSEANKNDTMKVKFEAYISRVKPAKDMAGFL
ncbi:MAG TPA: hypothetical protein VM734_13825 [Kofleriaceae bacterium]|jgi:hypothetical protein|nr:hypothetical protein [Kofleriaceae bacterium]